MPMRSPTDTGAGRHFSVEQEQEGDDIAEEGGARIVPHTSPERGRATLLTKAR